MHVRHNLVREFHVDTTATQVQREIRRPRVLFHSIRYIPRVCAPRTNTARSQRSSQTDHHHRCARIQVFRINRNTFRTGGISASAPRTGSIRLGRRLGCAYLRAREVYPTTHVTRDGACRGRDIQAKHTLGRCRRVSAQVGDEKSAQSQMHLITTVATRTPTRWRRVGVDKSNDHNGGRNLVQLQL